MNNTQLQIELENAVVENQRQKVRHEKMVMCLAKGITDLENDNEALRAKLAEVEGERDELARMHSHQVEYTQDLVAAYEVERDEARRWAAVWKQSAKMHADGKILLGQEQLGWNYERGHYYQYWGRMVDGYEYD